MKIRCIANSAKVLPEDYFVPRKLFDRAFRFDLTVGKDYLAYAVQSYYHKILYYTMSDRYPHYAHAFPSHLFEIVDNRLSQYWRYGLTLDHEIALAVDEWLNDPYFYDKLTDGKENETAIFEKMKALIDAEFS